MSDDFNPIQNPYSAPQAQITDVDQQNGQLAGLGARLGAAIIDGVILGFVTLVPVILFFGGWGAYVEKVATGGYIVKVVLAVLGLCVYTVVNGAFLAKNGQTIGKKLVGIKIVRTDGSKPSVGYIVLRRQGPISAFQLIPFAGMILGLVDILLIFRETRQCLHDNIADTRVINA